MTAWILLASLSAPGQAPSPVAPPPPRLAAGDRARLRDGHLPLAVAREHFAALQQAHDHGDSDTLDSLLGQGLGFRTATGAEVEILGVGVDLVRFRVRPGVPEAGRIGLTPPANLERLDPAPRPATPAPSPAPSKPRPRPFILVADPTWRPRIGDRVALHLTGDRPVPVATDFFHCDELARALRAHDADGFRQLQLSGAVRHEPAGTPVLILDVHDYSSLGRSSIVEARILDGKSKGDKIYAPPAFFDRLVPVPVRATPPRRR